MYDPIDVASLNCESKMISPKGFKTKEKSKKVIACKQMSEDTFYKTLLFLRRLYLSIQ